VFQRFFQVSSEEGTTGGPTFAQFFQWIVRNVIAGAGKQPRVARLEGEKFFKNPGQIIVDVQNIILLRRFAMAALLGPHWPGELAPRQINIGFQDHAGRVTTAAAKRQYLNVF